MVRRLIINADDYGLSREVNAAIEELVLAGRLSHVSALANGPGWEAAADFLGKHPKISVGVHLNAVEGRPLSHPSQIRPLIGADGQFAGLQKLLIRWLRHPLQIKRALEIEWRAQIERMCESGLQISHVDSHQHLHVFPPAWQCAVELSRKYGISALRLPLEDNQLPLRRAAALSLRVSLTVSRSICSTTGLLHNDHFLGFKRAGAYGLDELIADLKTLSPGLTEIALHPSTSDGVPYPELRGNLERQTLLDDRLWDEISNLRIELATWRTEHTESSEHP